MLDKVDKGLNGASMVLGTGGVGSLQPKMNPDATPSSRRWRRVMRKK